MPNYQIRTNSAPADQLAALHTSAFSSRGERGWRSEEFESLLKQPGSLCHGLFDHDDLLAFALWRQLGEEAELLTIAVAPDCQGQGLGGQLMAVAPDAARLYLEVAADNAPALALYRRFGFTEAGRRPRYYRRQDGSRADAIIMQRQRPA